MRSIRTPLTLIAILSIAINLTACVSLKVTSKGRRYRKQPFWQRVLVLSKIHHWYASGAFSVTHKQKTELANYQWHQYAKDHYAVHIESALDIYTMEITGRSGRVTMVLPDKQATAKTPEQLMQREFGWALPIRNLYYWARGLAAPGVSQRRYDQYGHLIYLRQQGWQIKLAHYIHFGKVDLPQQIDMQRPNLRLRIVIKNWHVVG
ncbi:MAG: lipoprotein insertase outer membrane protein LolB [Gammaproteobacteria bacterium]|nr:lipoprotein insertase outer membrane protein LolB [Gammaproteobacteria bacterium]